MGEGITFALPVSCRRISCSLDLALEAAEVEELAAAVVVVEEAFAVAVEEEMIFFRC